VNKEQPEEEQEGGLDPLHARWLVENRADTQRVSAKLYALLKAYPGEVSERAAGAQNLVAISFSLWRSVFYSDKEIHGEGTTEDAINLLSEMLQNNAIAYTQERKAKDWTFNYYLWNARMRLENLKESWPKAELGDLIPPVRSPKTRWKRLQKAFSKAVDHYEKLLEADSETRK